MKAFTSNQIWSFLTINLFRNLWCDKIGQYWPNSKLTNWLIHWPCHRLGCVKIQGKITTNYKLLVFTCFDKVFDVIEFGITFLNPIYHLRGKLLYWRVRAMPFKVHSWIFNAFFYMIQLQQFKWPSRPQILFGGPRPIHRTSKAHTWDGCVCTLDGVKNVTKGPTDRQRTMFNMILGGQRVTTIYN